MNWHSELRMKQKNRPLLIGLTGGIASGKTEAAKYLQGKGFIVLYADKIAHDIMDESNVIKILQRTFGTDIVVNGVVDRHILGTIVFKNDIKREQLNRIIHPRVRERMQTAVDNCTDNVLIIEIPLLIESGLEHCFDAVVNIYTSVENQRARLGKRNGFSAEEVEARINSQMKTKDKMERADFNLENSGNIKQLYYKLNDFIQNLEKIPFKKILRFTDC